jgi:hypothetical protein
LHEWPFLLNLLVRKTAWAFERKWLTDHLIEADESNTLSAWREERKQAPR